MDATTQILKAKYAPEQLAEELALETILKATLPGAQLDHLSYAMKRELCEVTKANNAFLNRTPVDIQKSLNVSQVDMRKALAEWRPQLNLEKLTDNEVAGLYVLEQVKQGRK